MLLLLGNYQKIKSVFRVVYDRNHLFGLGPIPKLKLKHYIKGFAKNFHVICNQFCILHIAFSIFYLFLMIYTQAS